MLCNTAIRVVLETTHLLMAKVSPFIPVVDTPALEPDADAEAIEGGEAERREDCIT